MPLVVRIISTINHLFIYLSVLSLSAAAQVHVTANPLDSAATTIPAGRTTIVVQQPSLSLDYGGCSTILLREGEERMDRRKSRICSDHIQQLLDVTSQFTSEDLHEFDKRYELTNTISCTVMSAWYFMRQTNFLT